MGLISLERRVDDREIFKHFGELEQKAQSTRASNRWNRPTRHLARWHQRRARPYRNTTRCGGTVSQLLTPGSSVIVSDYELSAEMGNDTDFIVVMP
jgi:hypothetical protein